MKVFISHSDSDEKWADLLRHELRTEDIDVWDPENEIVPGENFGIKSGKALRDSDALVVLLSPESVKSRMVQHEIDYALASPHFRNRLISLMVKETDEVPWILQKLPLIRAGRSKTRTVRDVAAALKKSMAPSPQ